MYDAFNDFIGEVVELFVIVGVVGFFVLIVYLFLGLFAEFKGIYRCRARHPVHGRCARDPHHFGTSHTGRRGGSWF